MTSQDRLDQFFRNYQLSKFEKGQMVLKDSEEPSALIYLEKGVIQQSIYTKNGGQITIHFFKPKSFFPLFWAINNMPNRFNYKTITEVELRLVPKIDFLNFIRGDTEVLESVLSRLLFALDGMTTRIEYLTSANARERVVGIIIFLAKHFGKQTRNGVRIDHQMTHQDLANLAGLTRETISRELEELSKEGVIVIKDRVIVITDMTKLHVI